MDFDFYPAAKSLIESEISVLDFLRNDPYIKENHYEFADAATKYYARSKGSYAAGFEFFSYFNIWHRPAHRGRLKIARRGMPPPNLRLVVASLIKLHKGTFQNVSYCLVVCRLGSKGFPILRKFHFDITFASGGTKRQSQAHPSCHLQYCGEMLPAMAEMGVLQTQLNQLNPWLSEPRVFYSPMSLALLVDMAFHEFPDERSRKFRERPEWKDLIRKQEALVLKPFYEKCVDVITDTHDQKKTLADAFYVG
jgi:hypothetical protein